MKPALVWFRQDLRLDDNPAFSSACQNHEFVIPLYILDDATQPLGAAQKWWLHESLKALGNSLQNQGLRLILRKGDAYEVLVKIIQAYGVCAIYWNRCYVPRAIERDTKIKSAFVQQGLEVTTSNGSLLREPWEVTTQKGTPFKVYTAFWKEFLKTPVPFQNCGLPSAAKKIKDIFSEDLEGWSLCPRHPNWAANFSAYWQPGEAGAKQKLATFLENPLARYKNNRNIPSQPGTSRLSPHLHFGEISVQTVWRAVNARRMDRECSLASLESFLSQLGWREFSYHVLYHYPDFSAANFRKEFDHFPWREDAIALKRWQEGMTGYPLVDAGMRELWHTGYMHNRVRMIVASFLTKNLLIDWRYGAQWFWDTLLDADLANNSMGWQWVAGTGLDAAPYFRIFNPILQSEKFDPQGDYIRRWVPELQQVPLSSLHAFRRREGISYPPPLVDYPDSRLRALQSYKTLSGSSSI